MAADVWSVTSYNELRREALKMDRWNRLHPAEPAKKPYIQHFWRTEGPIIAASDYMKIGAGSDRALAGRPLFALGTDGFGRSDNRDHLRAHFEVNAASIAGRRFAAGARRQIRPEKSREGSDRSKAWTRKKPSTTTA